ncbi:ArnT family glycosyltransferase [Amycolatopsis sp. H20-H5]|uniref:ArnT family glycosyltransferase n=1 Tax=Amycolatopsis sp. H20-H5 TaxID=3046309 RepID=UPI002DBF55FB|nr:glycosyltransferase family 39 protein [Amycolatopsis sp. H20-H5]MEC3979087.1 glycosyltransferase family 39 protein [Amycolatopsis sp. H20-H5]
MTAATDGTRLTPARTGGTATPPTGGASRAQAWALVVICVLAGLLYVWAIGSSEYGNTYYSAAVKSMTESLGNFLFGSFDPYGVVTVDKPPMSLWPQVVSVSVFGFHSWSLLLPQAIEGVAAVFLLHRTVRLWAGENVALLASLIFAITPITVAINRDNNPDTLLVLLMVASAYAFTRSVRTADARNRTKWLLLCAFFVGCGFVTKMMAAWIILPGLALAFLIGSTSPLKRRITDLLAAGGVVLVSSFWWTALHDFWPGDKPYMGGSTNGSAWELIFGYNGFGRLFGEGERPGGGAPPAGADIPAGMGTLFGGGTGITRMFSAEVGGQISWLLPLSLLVLVFVSVTGIRRLRAKAPGDPVRRAGWFLWGSWLVVTALVFSFAQGIWHPYYTTMLAPAIAALAAAGIVLLWRKYRDANGFEWTLLPLAVAVTAVWAYVLISRDTAWNGWARWAVVGTTVVALAGLVLGRLAPRRRQALGRPAFVAGLVAMLLTPAVWSVSAAGHTISAMPSAGPATAGFGALTRGELPAGMSLPGGASRAPQGGGGFGGGFGGAELSAENRKILDYAIKNAGDAEITLAVEGGAMAASPFIIGSDATVIGMGGFLGSDNAPSVDQLQQWTTAGNLKFVLATARGTGGRGRAAGGMGGMGDMGGEAQQQRSAWIEQHCQVVAPAAYGGAPAAPAEQSPIPGLGGSTLYSCH